MSTTSNGQTTQNALNNLGNVSTDVKDQKVFTVSNKNDFDNILAEAGNKLILVEFFAEWCGPCKLIGTKLDELAKLYNGKAIIMKIDVDDFEDIAIEYNVTSMPTFLFLKNKQKLEQFAGSNSEKVEKSLKKFCGEYKNEGNSTSAFENVDHTSTTGGLTEEATANQTVTK